MNNNTLYYVIDNSGNKLDLIDIFKPLDEGTKYPNPTGYIISTGQDLNDIFAQNTGTFIDFDTGYNVSDTDLKFIFAPRDPFNIIISNQSTYMNTYTFYQNGYSISQFTNNHDPSNGNIWVSATCNINFTTSGKISIILVSGGGAGGWSLNSNAGGGGAGGNFELINDITVNKNDTYTITVGSGGNYYINGYQNGQSSSFIGGLFNIEISGGNQGENATVDNSGFGGSSINGGEGGNGGMTVGQDGQNGDYFNYSTVYGSTLSVGGGGGGGLGSNTELDTGCGSGAFNGIGGNAGEYNVIVNKTGLGYGSGGGGGGGIVATGTSETSGGSGGNGLVVIYFKSD